MNRYQIEELYRMKGITDYQFKSIDEITSIFGIDPTGIEGYSKLNSANKEIYARFIINFLNTQGLEPRNTVIPNSINYVEHTEFLGKENLNDEYYTVLGSRVTAIYNDGTKHIIRTWLDEEYKEVEVLKEETTNYLRFEYQEQDRKTWLHVVNNGYEWY